MATIAAEAGGGGGIASLSDLYASAVIECEVPCEATMATLWQRWLWELDVNEPIRDDLGDMNRCHIVGLLLCVLQSHDVSNVTPGAGAIADVLPETPLVHLSPKPIAAYTVREVMDQLRCLQLNWGKVLSVCPPESAQQALICLMARTGVLATHAYGEGPPSPLDDPQHITPIPSRAQDGAGGLFIVTRRFLRDVVITLGALFRVAYFVTQATVVPNLSDEERDLAASAFRTHLIEASVDEFYFLQQVLVLAPGMRLSYKADFAGMYNDVSQVVYFHYPKYSRQAQAGLREILCSAAHTLPLVRQLLPDVPIVYDDDSAIPGLTPGAPPVKAGFAWLVTCGTIFLLKTTTGEVFASQDGSLLPLVGYLTNATGRTLHSEEDAAASAPGADGEDGAARQTRAARARRAWLSGAGVGGGDGGGTAHGHAVLL